MRKLPFLTLLVATLCACGSPLIASDPAPSAPAQSTIVAKPDPEKGLEFAQAHCSQCHAVKALQLSPNPEAPPFESVANMPGLTKTTLRDWLRDSHNFPEIMDFALETDQIDVLAAYILTLRKSD